MGRYTRNFLILFLVILTVISIESPTTAHASETLDWEMQIQYESDNLIQGVITSFDVNQRGEILLLCQETSLKYAVHIYVLDKNGAFIKEYRISEPSGGTVLARFTDHGEICVLSVREDRAFLIQNDRLVHEEHIAESDFNDVTVSSSIQKQVVLRGNDGSTYSLVQPGWFRTIFYNQGIYISKNTNGTESIIWRDNEFLRRSFNRNIGILFLGFLCVRVLFFVCFLKSFKVGKILGKNLASRISACFVTWVVLVITEHNGSLSCLRGCSPLIVLSLVLPITGICIVCDAVLIKTHCKKKKSMH